MKNNRTKKKYKNNINKNVKIIKLNKCKNIELKI